MSREFRWVGSCYFHYALQQATEEEGRHEISKSLTQLYAALMPLETDSAAYEACDSGADRVVLGLQNNWPAIKAAFDALANIHARDKELITGIIRQMNLQPAS